MQIILNSLNDTANFAKRLASYLTIGDAVALKGDLGSGKTTLAGYIINRLSGKNENIISPTFNIVQLYDTPNFIIWHFDLYRLKSEDELVEIGLDEALNSALSIIEWPELAEELLPEETLFINLSCSKNEERVLSLSGRGKWAKILKGF